MLLLLLVLDYNHDGLHKWHWCSLRTKQKSQCLQKLVVPPCDKKDTIGKEALFIVRSFRFIQKFRVPYFYSINVSTSGLLSFTLQIAYAWERFKFNCEVLVWSELWSLYCRYEHWEDTRNDWGRERIKITTTTTVLLLKAAKAFLAFKLKTCA